MSLKWNGDNILRRINRASRVGINRTMGQCVLVAKQDHAFTNRTTIAEGSISVVTGAVTQGDKSFGIWGSKGVIYFKYLEFGTRFTQTRTSIKDRLRIMRTGVLKTGRKNAGVPPWQGGSWKPTLRPAAVAVYPKLQGYIREAFKRGA